MRGAFVVIEEIGPVDLAAGEPRSRRTTRHRNQQRLTYLLEGEWECSALGGGRVLLQPGDASWMTARAGVVRSDGPTTSMLDQGGSLHCIHVTLRLPQRLSTPDGHRFVRADDIPEIVGGPASVRVLAGSLLSTPGAFHGEQPFVITDWRVVAGASVDIPVLQEHEVLLYAYRDVVWIGANGLALREGQLAVLGPGKEVVLRGPEKSPRAARILLLTGPSRCW
jgi:hypothetical protein